MKLAISTAFLAFQCCQFVQSSTDHHADDLTSRVSKTLSKQFKTMSSIMKKHPVNTKSIHALQTMKKNFQSLHRGLLHGIEDVEGTQCEVDVHNLYSNQFGDGFGGCENFQFFPDWSGVTWNGDESDLIDLSDACADLGGSLLFVNMEGCDRIPVLHVPECFPDSCSIEEALQALSGPSEVDDDFFDDNYECNIRFELSEGPPDLTNSSSCEGDSLSWDLYNDEYWAFQESVYNQSASFAQPHLSGLTWTGDESELNDTCADLGGSIWFINKYVQGEECSGVSLLHWPKCVPNSCTAEEASDLLVEGPNDAADLINEHFDCKIWNEFSEGEPEITDVCYSRVYEVGYQLNFFILSIFPFLDAGDERDDFVANYTQSCEELDGSVFFTKFETNGKCFYAGRAAEFLYNGLPECFPNECATERALEINQEEYSRTFRRQEECIFELEYKSSLLEEDDDKTLEESPSTPPSPNGPSSKAPKSMKSDKSKKCYDDASGTFVLDIGNVVGCDWLTKHKGNEEERKNKYCSRHEVETLCPVSCNFCECKDDASYTFELTNTGATKDCSWISRNKAKKETRITNYCTKDFDGGALYNACTESCGLCPSK